MLTRGTRGLWPEGPRIRSPRISPKPASKRSVSSWPSRATSSSPRSLQVLHSGGQPEDARHVQIARLELRRQLVRLPGALALGAGAPLPDAAQLQTRPEGGWRECRCRAARASPCGRSREKIDAERADVHRQMPQRLRRVAEHQRSVPAGDRPSFCDRLNGAGDVRGVRDGHQSGRGAQGPLHVLGIDEPAESHGDDGDFDSLALLQVGQRAEHGVVFHLGRHDVIALVDEAVQGQVERVGAVGREDQVRRIGQAQQRGDVPPRSFDARETSTASA